MNPSDHSSLGRRVAQCREQLGWTQKKLAEEAEISVTFLSEVENDKRVPGAEVLLRLATALGTSLDYLMRGEMPAAPTRHPIVIPPGLAEFADEVGLSVSEANDLLKAHRMVVARRSRGGEHEEARELSKEDWRRFHEWFRKSPL